MQRGAELDALANDFVFLQGDHRRGDFNICFRASAYANQLLKDTIIFWAAIGIAGAVFRDCANVDGVSADDFSPTDRYGKKMGVAKRDVRDGDFVGFRMVRNMLMLRNGDAPVGKRGASDGSKMIQLNNQPLLHIIKVGDGFECLAFALLRALPITSVQQRDVFRAVSLYGNRRANARIHATAEQDDCFDVLSL